MEFFLSAHVLLLALASQLPRVWSTPQSNLLPLLA